MSTAVAQPATAQPSNATIGFRPEGPAAAGSMAVLGVLVVVLGLAVAGLWFAQRRGWLKSWAMRRPVPTAGRLVVEERIRLSPKTVLYRVRDAEQAFHIIESSVHVTVQRS